MNFPVLHLVGQRLAPELMAVARELQRQAVVYCFESTDEMLAAWRLARRVGKGHSLAPVLRGEGPERCQNSFTPTAVVWLQSRSGEFSQQDITAAQTLDPLARLIVVAGCWSEGEPRSGRPLTGVQRVYWHQGWPALRSLIASDDAQDKLPSNWIAIHAAPFIDYQGLAGVCHSLGQRTIWQSDRGPAISSEPAVRLFAGWPAWEAWQAQSSAGAGDAAPSVLLLDFPRPADFLRAQRESIAQVLALPFHAADLQRAIAAIHSSPHRLPLPRSAPKPQIRHDLTAVPRRRSA